MCFAQPVSQKSPANPANYPLNENYGQVKSRTITPDGKVHGGATIADQHQANMKAYGQSKPPAFAGKVGANLRM